MGPLLLKLGPTALVLVLTAWCCWSSDSEPAGPNEARKEGATIAPGLLAGVKAPDPDRDPFGLKTAPPADSGRKKAPAPAAVASSPKTTAVAKTARSAPPDLASLVRGLSLKATCARENGGVALINGRFYNQGETVPGSIGSPVALVIDRVCEDRVVFRYEDQTVELKFSEGLTKSTAPRSGASKPTSRPSTSRSSPKQQQ
jgi:hypothetical protein